MQNVIEDNDNIDDSVSILGALIYENDEPLKITFLDSITKKYVIQKYKMMISGIEPYLL